MESFLRGTYPVFLPSKTVSFVSLTLNIACLRFVALKMDFEIAECIDLERTARMHDDGGVGGLDNRGTNDAIPRHKVCAVVDRSSRGLLEVSPVDVSFAQPGLDVDLGAESLRPRKFRMRRCRGCAQA